MSASAPLTPRERLSSIVEDKPIYSSNHDGAALALVKLSDYDAWSFAEHDWLLTLLHAIHLRIDALVQQYGFYKVDFHAGVFTVAANVSGNVVPQAPQLMLDFAVDVLRVLSEIKLPTGVTQIRTQISLTASPLSSAVLGKTALKYSVHGRAEVMARKLLESYGRDGCIISSKDFVEILDRGMVMWNPLPLMEDTLNGLRSERGFLYEQQSQEETSHKHKSSHQQNLTFWSELRRLIPSLCFEDPDMEDSFRLFQADRFAVLDMLYISLSASLVGLAAVRAWRYDISYSSLSYLILSFIGAAVPLCGVMFWGECYRHKRQYFLMFFRFIKLITVGVFGLQRQTTSMFLMISTYSTLHGLHAIGTQLVLPTHLFFQLLSVMVIGLKSFSSCDVDDSVNSYDGWDLATSLLPLFGMTLIVPSFVAYQVELTQRRVYSHGSSSTKKQA